MSWRNIPKKENYMPLFAEDWNAVIDALDDLYQGKFGQLTRDLIPSKHAAFDIGSQYRWWRNLFVQKIFTDAIYLGGRNILDLIGRLIDLTKIDTDLIPVETDTYDIGKPSKRFRDVHAKHGWFDQVYIQGKPVSRVTVDLTRVETDIVPVADNIYDIGKPSKRFRNIWAKSGYFEPLFTDTLDVSRRATIRSGYFMELYLRGKPITVPLPVEYISRVVHEYIVRQYVEEIRRIIHEYVSWQYVEEIIKQYMMIHSFSQYALDQLQEAFGKDIKEIKVLLSQQLAREVYDTYTFLVDTSKETSPYILPIPAMYHKGVIRGWFILTDSKSGEIELRTLVAYNPIIWLPASVVQKARNDQIWIETYKDDPLALYWRLLDMYAKIFLQLSLIEQYIGETIRATGG